jgi:hypothetical protein
LIVPHLDLALIVRRHYDHRHSLEGILYLMMRKAAPKTRRQIQAAVTTPHATRNIIVNLSVMSTQRRTLKSGAAQKYRLFGPLPFRIDGWPTAELKAI